MDRRHGVESQLGIGGGMVSLESQKNLDKAEELCRKKKPEKALPYLRKAAQDHNNLDALIQVAFLLDRPSAVEALEAAELRGRVILKEALGPKCFDDDGPHVGGFWNIVETRPYMRVLQALVRLYFEEKQYEKSTNTIIEMLRLCPGDNMSQRTWLGSHLIRVGRYSDALFFAQAWIKKFFEEGDNSDRGGTAFAAPSRKLESPDHKEGLCKFGPGAILHTAALASFKLYGDCPESRQYLKCAVTANRHVLLKVLGCISRPENLNMDARTLNGPEDAHDYLWLSQDLWMEMDVWNWANSSADVKAVILKTCSKGSCKTRETKVTQFKWCSACHQVFYCSQACQKEDWPNHKPDCRARKKLKDTIRAVQQGKSIPKDNDMPIFSADFSAGGMSFKQHSN